ncbi:MAG: hypothetical protein ACR2OA_04505 [Rubripirellula sp.]
MNKSQDKALNISGTKFQSASEVNTNPPLGSAPTATPLGDFLQRQTQHRAESAEAFQQDATSEPSMRELFEEQVKLQRQVRGIKNHVVRVQQGLLICQFLNVLIAGALVAIAAFLYLRPGNATPLAEMRESSEAWLQENEKFNREWPNQTGQTESLGVTPEEISIISNFLNRARTVKIRFSDDAFVRRDKKTDYLRLLVDLSTIGEEFAAQRNSREACEMLIKVAKYAKGNQSDQNDTPEQEALFREINKFCRMP